MPGQQAMAPGSDPSRSGHATHSARDDDPFWALKVPAGQGRHQLALVAPVEGLYVPAGHASAMPVKQNWPTGKGCPDAELVWRRHRTPSAHIPLQLLLVRPVVLP